LISNQANPLSGLWFDGAAALSPWDKIGSHGARNFVLCKKPQAATNEAAAEDGSGTSSLPRRGSGSWKSWFNLNLKVSSH